MMTVLQGLSENAFKHCFQAQ